MLHRSPQHKTPVKPILQRDLFFIPGNVVTCFGGQDLVLHYSEPTEQNEWHWFVEVVSVEKDLDGRWVRSGRPRNHSTEPDLFSKILDSNVKA